MQRGKQAPPQKKLLLEFKHAVRIVLIYNKIGEGEFKFHKEHGLNGFDI